MPVIDIIIPVYQDHDEIRHCIDSVLKYPQRNRFYIIVIDDASREVNISEYFNNLKNENNNITIIRNEQNKGFVASVNTGMALHPDRDVVLLNSDTEVANNWLDRLHGCAYQSSKIGTVTPFSNNATICSFPLICKENELLPEWSVEELDTIFSEANNNLSIEIPTTVGFCMYVKRGCLNTVGLFDEKKFGRGYGEENDFCMRAAKKGWRHELCADTFVYHKGGTSFSSEKDKRVASAMKKLDRLYPDYHQLIHSHIKINPARSLRINALVHLFRKSKKQTMLFINHNMGGGTEKHIQELSNYLQDNINAVVLRTDKNNQIVLSLGSQIDSKSFRFTLPDDYHELLRILRFIHISKLHIHHTKGIHHSLLNLSHDLQVPFDVTMHDYYFINANPTLIGETAQFCEYPKSRDQLCNMAYPVPGNETPEKWREKNNAFLMSADRVFVPSHYTANLYKEYFTGLNPVVTYHPDWEHDAPYPDIKLTSHNPHDPIKILVIGALSREKGADLLETCAKIAGNQKFALEFHLIGYAYRPLDSAVIQHGAYFDEQLSQLIADVSPHIAWFPAQWPETYSYTLSAVLREALPVAAPDIGAFPERLAGRPYTWIHSWKQSAKEWVRFFKDLEKNIYGEDKIANSCRWGKQTDSGKTSFSYERDYIAHTYESNDYDTDDIDIEWIEKYLNHNKVPGNENLEISKRERVLTCLLKLRENRFALPLLKFIPFSVQQNIKRNLSSRPVHEYLLRNSGSEKK